jgi:hypothetical protein
LPRAPFHSPHDLAIISFLFQCNQFKNYKELSVPSKYYSFSQVQTSWLRAFFRPGGSRTVLSLWSNTSPGDPDPRTSPRSCTIQDFSLRSRNRMWMNRGVSESGRGRECEVPSAEYILPPSGKYFSNESMNPIVHWGPLLAISGKPVFFREVPLFFTCLYVSRCARLNPPTQRLPAYI